MPLESAPFISDLVATNPPSTDQKSEGAAHLRVIKGAIKATFPSVTGAVTPTHTELNYAVGVTSAIQTQLNAEATTRGNADTAEALTRGNADTAETLARINADALLAPRASPTFTGTVVLPATGSGATEAVRKDYADGLAFATTLPAQTGNAGKVVATDGTIATWTSLKTINAQSLIGAGVIALQAPPIVRKAYITASTTHTIPVGVLIARVYAVGAGAAATLTASGGGGGMAYGDISVVAGDVLTVNIATGIATVVKGGVTMLTANPASGVTAGTATKDAGVTNGGNFSGGAGFSIVSAGGASSGSPLGVGVAGVSPGASQSGGAGWGGSGGVGGGGGGVGGSAVGNVGGLSLTIPSFDPLLVGLESASESGLGRGGSGQSSGGFGGGGGGGAPGASGGFGGGGGGAVNTGGAGGLGGGGGSGSTTGGAGGGAAVLIFY